MDTKLTKTYFFAAVFSTFIVLHIFVMFSLRIYPFVDLPNHLAAATIFKFYGSPTNHFSDYYAINTFPPTNVFHLLFCSLNIFPSVEFGNKMFYCLYVLLFPLSILMLIRKLGGNQWFSLLAFLLLYNYNLHWGFVGCTIAIPFILFLFYFLREFLNGNRLGIMVIIAALFVLLFSMHLLPTVFSIVFFVLCCIQRYKTSPLKLLLKSLVLIPVLVLIILWLTYNAADSGLSNIAYLLDYYKTTYFSGLVKRGQLWYVDNWHLYPGILGYSVALFFAGCMLAPFLLGLFMNRKFLIHDINPDSLKQVYLFLLCSLLFYFLLPESIPPQFCLLHERFAVFFFLAIILFGSLVYARKKSPVLNLSLCVICILHFILYVGYFKDFAQQTRSFTRDLFPENSSDKTLAALIYDSEFRGTAIYIHFQNYWIIWKQGIATTFLIDSSNVFAIRRKVNEKLLPIYLAWVGITELYDGRYSTMDYILVHGKPHSSALINFTLSKVAGNWSLYKKVSQEH